MCGVDNVKNENSISLLFCYIFAGEEMRMKSGIKSRNNLCDSLCVKFGTKNIVVKM